MDYLQYLSLSFNLSFFPISFKPCYKWITFNTKSFTTHQAKKEVIGFKPCYKWITFNTLPVAYPFNVSLKLVLNLVINGLPSIHMYEAINRSLDPDEVLNLVINGLPSILKAKRLSKA